MEREDIAGLVELVLAGDKLAEESLVKWVSGEVHALIYARLRDGHATQDVVQEVMMAVFGARECLRQLASANSPGAWIRAIAHHKAVDWFRRNKQRGRVICETDLLRMHADKDGISLSEVPKDGCRGPSEMLESQELVRRLRKALTGLEIQIVSLKMADRTYEEIASTLGMSRRSLRRICVGIQSKVREFLE